jgi:hypothetical protein
VLDGVHVGQELADDERVLLLEPVMDRVALDVPHHVGQVEQPVHVRQHPRVVLLARCAQRQGSPLDPRRRLVAARPATACHATGDLEPT